MKVFSRALAVAAIAVLAVSCKGGSKDGANSGSQATSNDKQAKYVFYFIGDGMAAPQVRLAEAALSSQTFLDNYAKLTNIASRTQNLYIKSLPTTGLATSNAKNRYITDSAAAGTALATGNKTDVGIISETPEGEELTTIAERAKAKGMKVGIVSSVSIDHATPASFYAHAASRNEYAEISDQLLETGFDYFGGGSVKFDSRARTAKIDKAEAYAQYRQRAEQKGFQYVTTKAEFDKLGKGNGKPVIATIDKLANQQYSEDGFALPYTIDLDVQTSEDDKISLAQFTQKGIDLLENKDGFFMMVEGGKIDWACHANDAATCAYEVVAFDQAIGVALDFAAKHPDETLIVVTGDHDCGGLALGFAGTKYESAFDVLANATSSYTVFASAVAEKIAAGESFDKLLQFACSEYGFTNNITDGSEGVLPQSAELSDVEVALLKEAYSKSRNSKNNFSQRELYSAAYGGYDPFTTTCTSIVNNKSGVDFASYSHTAVPVMVFAKGAGESLFSGYYDNTDIAKKIAIAAGL